MLNVRYKLGTEAQKCMAGETNLKRCIERPLDTNGCTILLCTSGKAIVTTNFQRKLFQQGNAAILFNDIVFTPLCISNTFSVIYISLSSEIIEDAFYKITSLSFWDFIYRNSIFPTTPIQNELLYSWCKQTEWIIKEIPFESGIPLLRNSIYNLLVAIDHEIKKEAVNLNLRTKKDSGWMLLGKFSALLTEFCPQRKDVKFYADKLCITPDYLYKLCYKEMQQSPKEIIDQRVLLEIKTFLLNTDLSVKNIAEELSFEDPSYMCRFFRRLTGLSPIDFRNSFNE